MKTKTKKQFKKKPTKKTRTAEYMDEEELVWLTQVEKYQMGLTRWL